MKNIPYQFLILLLFAFSTCKKDDISEKHFDRNEEINFNSGWFPSEPINFIEVNSSYDDYNPAWPENLETDAFTLLFSTNRKSGGINFDLIGYSIHLYYYTDTKELSFHAQELDTSNSISGVSIIDLFCYSSLYKLNSEFDEFGPYFSPIIESRNIFYSSNPAGNQDIKFIYNERIPIPGSSAYSNTLMGPFEMKCINTYFEEAYPSMNENYLYFCSNRDGPDFDIYSFELIEQTQLLEWFKSDTNVVHIEKIDNLSSIGNDKCPYVNGNLMVFTSDDESGYGGYDLWYSIKENGDWQPPRNFGEKINSPYDEYRPAVMLVSDSNNDIMIFSSNRPEGQGGFDLYYVGIMKMI